MASHYNTETRAEVIEMGRQGKTSRHIARKLNMPERTAQGWLKTARDRALAEDRDPRLVDGEYRLAYMGQQIQEAQLEELAAKIDAGESVLHYIIPVNAIKGTSIDKVAKQPVALNAQTIIVNFIAERPPIIEGEATEVLSEDAN